MVVEAAAAPSRSDVVGNVRERRREKYRIEKRVQSESVSGKSYRKESTARKRNGRLLRKVSNRQQPDIADNNKVWSF